MNVIKQGISRGDIFYADLSSVVGREQGEIRLLQFFDWMEKKLQIGYTELKAFSKLCLF